MSITQGKELWLQIDRMKVASQLNEMERVSWIIQLSAL